jgi:hypothetical protein
MQWPNWLPRPTPRRIISSAIGALMFAISFPTVTDNLDRWWGWLEDWGVLDLDETEIRWAFATLGIVVIVIANLPSSLFERVGLLASPVPTASVKHVRYRVAKGLRVSCEGVLWEHRGFYVGSSQPIIRPLCPAHGTELLFRSNSNLHHEERSLQDDDAIGDYHTWGETLLRGGQRVARVR